ncbi:MAG: tandem-95 repeat protein, partial [Myxococcales bacterium]|nr:tandem-95 repeat protein [Myxococcales bacterium]
LVDGPLAATITFTNVNDAPTAIADADTALEGTTITIDLAANDTDPDNALDLTSIVITSPAGNGSIVVNGDGTVDYTHDGSETVGDSFSYTIDDITGNTSNVAAVTITVNPLNDLPVAVADAAGVLEGGTVAVDLAVNDSDADDGLDLTSIVIVSGPTNGSLVVNLDGTVDYTHDGSNTTSDSFTYTIDDASGQTSPSATVTLTITPVDDDAPTLVVNTGSSLVQGGSITLANTELAFTDTEVPNTSITFTLTSGPSNGQLELTTAANVAISSFTQDDLDNNRVVYIHDGSNTTSDTFGFDVDDGVTNTITAQTFSLNAPVVIVLPPEPEPEPETEPEENPDPGETTEQDPEPSTESDPEPEEEALAVAVPLGPFENSAARSNIATLRTDSLENDRSTVRVASVLADPELEAERNGSHRSEIKLTSDQRTFVGSERMARALDQIRTEMTNSAEEATTERQAAVSAAEGTMLAASLGWLAFLLRGGSLAALAFSSLPLWSSVDTLAILALSDEERERLEADMRKATEHEDENDRAVGNLLDDR